MTPQQIVGVAARLVAIWLAILAFQAIGIGQAMLSQRGQSTSVPYFIAALYLGVGLFLWFFPMFVAHKLVPRAKFENTLRLPAAHDEGGGLRCSWPVGRRCTRLAVACGICFAGCFLGGQRSASLHT